MDRTALITVATFSFPHEAQIAKAKLDSEGIPAFIIDEHTINAQWLYSNALGGVKLQVPLQYSETAKEVVAEDRAELLDTEFDAEMRRCPSCGSEDSRPYTKGKSPALVLFLLLGFPLFFYKHGYICRVCGRFFEK